MTALMWFYISDFWLGFIAGAGTTVLALAALVSWQSRKGRAK